MYIFLIFFILNLLQISNAVVLSYIYSIPLQFLLESLLVILIFLNVALCTVYKDEVLPYIFSISLDSIVESLLVGSLFLNLNLVFYIRYKLTSIPANSLVLNNEILINDANTYIFESPLVEELASSGVDNLIVESPVIKEFLVENLSTSSIWDTIIVSLPGIGGFMISVIITILSQK